MHEFNSDFYGFEMKAVVLGYIRPELDYTSRGDIGSCSLRFENGSDDCRAEALIDDIETDKRVALNSLARPAYQRFHVDGFAK